MTPQLYQQNRDELLGFAHKLTQQMPQNDIRSAQPTHVISLPAICALLLAFLFAPFAGAADANDEIVGVKWTFPQEDRTRVPLMIFYSNGIILHDDGNDVFRGTWEKAVRNKYKAHLNSCNGDRHNATARFVLSEGILRQGSLRKWHRVAPPENASETSDEANPKKNNSDITVYGDVFAGLMSHKGIIGRADNKVYVHKDDITLRKKYAAMAKIWLSMSTALRQYEDGEKGAAARAKARYKEWINARDEFINEAANGFVEIINAEENGKFKAVLPRNGTVYLF